MTAKLARQAARLNAQAGLVRALPSLVLMTDDERLADPLPAAHALPPGSLIVLRARDAGRRADLALALTAIARVRKLSLLIAADPELATRVSAGGIHLPEVRIGEAAYWRARRPNWLITCAAHSLGACGRAALAGIDAVFLSPIFPTRSHPGRASLGPLRARCIAGLSPVPVYALGGIDAQRAARLGRGPFAGLAAVEGLAQGR